MIRRWFYIMLFFFSLTAVAAMADQRFPPPDFETGHVLPTTTTPVPRADWRGWMDVAVLAVALGLASWLTLKNRSRRWIFLLTLFSLAYFGFYREGCVCAIGSIQNVTLAGFDSGYILPLTVLAFFVLPLLFTLFFGRGFCSSVCPLGAIQEVVLLKPMQIPYWLEQALSLLAYVYLGLAVLFAATGAAFVICRYDPFVSFFRLDGPLNVVTLGVVLLLLGTVVGRPYCRFLCPYGVLLRLMSRFSRQRISITPAECTRCHLCADACPYGAIQKPQAAPAAGQLVGPKRRLGWLLLLCPVLVAAGALLGLALSKPFARMHPTVRLADEVAVEQKEPSPEPSDPMTAFVVSGRTTEDLYQEAEGIQAKFNYGVWILGAFVGLVVGIKLIRAAIYRSRTDYRADPGRCLACGRCFAYCPVEQERLLRVRGVS